MNLCFRINKLWLHVVLLSWLQGLMCFVGKGVSPEIMRNLFDVPHFGAMPEYLVSTRLYKFVKI